MTMHEEYSRDYKVEGASNRRFGLIIGGILVLIAGIRVYRHGEVDGFSAALSVVGVALMVIGVFVPDALASANRAWSKLGVMLHKVTNPLFLGAMFVFAIVPTGLLMRALGTDPMARRLSPDANYWVKRTKTSSTPDSLKQPF
jgi:peptidoglycan/LPS O-acetylase OafA/YrhL